MEKIVVGRQYISDTYSEFQDDGFWKVVATIKDRALYEGEETWVEEEISSMSLDTDYGKALQTVMNSTLGYIVDNVHKNGFSGLIEYREYERNLKKSKEEKGVSKT